MLFQRKHSQLFSLMPEHCLSLFELFEFYSESPQVNFETFANGFSFLTSVMKDHFRIGTRKIDKFTTLDIFFLIVDKVRKSVNIFFFL